MADENIVIGVELNDRFSAPSKKVVKSLDDIGDEVFDASARFRIFDESVDGAGETATRAQGRIHLLTGRIKKLGREATQAAVKAKVLDSVLRRLDKSMRPVGGRHAKPPPGGDKGGNRGMIAGIGGMPITMFVGAMTVIGALIPVLAGAVGALAAAALGAAGALAPLVGLAATGAGVYMAFAQGIGTVVVALKGIGDAVGAVRDTSKTIQEVRAELFKFNEYGGRNFANKFVRNISSIGTSFDYLRTGIQTRLIPSLNDFVNAGKTLLPTLQRGLQETASQIIPVIQQTSKFIQTAQAQQKIGTIMSANAKAAGSLGRAAESGFRLLLNVLEAASPLLVQVTKDFEGFVRRISISSDLNASGLSDFFESTYNVLRKVVKITTDFSAALYNVAKIGTPLGTAMGNSFISMAENFRAFTESSEGIQKIRDWFAQMTPIIYELGYLVRDLAYAFFDIGMNDGVASLSEQFRTELLPIIVDFIKNINDNLLPTLLEIITSVGKFIAALNPLGAIVPILYAISKAFEIIAAGIEALGPVGKIVTAAIVAIIFSVKGAIIVFGFFERAAARAALATAGFNRALTFASGGVKKFSFTVRTMTAMMGGVGLALTALGALFLAFGSDVSESQMAARDWADSLFDLEGALAANSAALTSKKLTEQFFDFGNGMERLTDVTQEVGIANEDLVKSLMGTDAEWSALEKRLVTYVKAMDDAGNYAASGKAYQVLQYLRGLRGEFEVASASADQHRSTLDALEGASGGAADAFGNLLNVTDRLARATENLNRAVQRLQGLLSERASSRQYLEDLEALRKSLKDNGASFNKFTEEGRANLDAIDKVYETTLERVNGLLERGNTSKAIELMRRTKRDLAAIAAELPPGARQAINKQMSILNTMLNDIVKKTETVQTQKWYTRINQDVDFRRKYMVNGRPIGSLKQAMEAMPEDRTTPTVQMNVTGSVDIKNIDVVTTTTQGLVDSLMIVGSRHDPKIGTGQIVNAKTQAQLLEDKLLALTGKTWTVNVVYKEKKTRATGGPVSAGVSYIVGEKGPEAFVGESGRMTMIGVHGQQQMRFPEDGFVVPNHALPQAEVSSKSAEYQLPSSPTINIGTINAKSDIDIVKAVKKGIAEAERNRRERS